MSDEPVFLELSDLWKCVLKVAYMYYLQKTSYQALLKVSLVLFPHNIQKTAEDILVRKGNEFTHHSEKFCQ